MSDSESSTLDQEPLPDENGAVAKGPSNAEQRLAALPTETRAVVLSCAETLIVTMGSAAVRVVDVATEAGVGIPTVYYYFESRTRLIAMAQLQRYQRVSAPLLQFLEDVETAVRGDAEEDFWRGISESLTMLWTWGHEEPRGWMARLIMDIWEDPLAESALRASLDARFARWVSALEAAKKKGWIKDSTDSNLMMFFQWSSSIGQILFCGSSAFEPGPWSAPNFFRHVAGAPAGRTRALYEKSWRSRRRWWQRFIASLWTTSVGTNRMAGDATKGWPGVIGPSETPPS